MPEAAAAAAIGEFLAAETVAGMAAADAVFGAVVSDVATGALATEAAVGAGVADAAIGWGATDASLGAAGSLAAEAGGSLTAGLTESAIAASELALPTTSGGWLIGGEGLLGSTGNTLADGLLNTAANKFGSSVATGNSIEDSLKGAVLSGAGDGFAGLLPNFGTSWLNSAVGGAIKTGVSGGNPLAGALGSGVGSVVRTELSDAGVGDTLARAGGAAAGNAAGTAAIGGDPTASALAGGVGAATSGMLNAAGVNPLASSIAASAAGSAATNAFGNNHIAPLPGSSAGAGTTAITRQDPVFSNYPYLGFATALPYTNARNVNWMKPRR